MEGSFKIHSSGISDFPQFVSAEAAKYFIEVCVCGGITGLEISINLRNKKSRMSVTTI